MNAMYTYRVSSNDAFFVLKETANPGWCRGTWAIVLTPQPSCRTYCPVCGKRTAYSRGKTPKIWAHYPREGHA